MKRIILSLALITLSLGGIAGATYAYFSHGMVLGADTNNTFSTGTVTIGGFNMANLSVTGLVPGKDVFVNNFGINYLGDVNADIYAGATGTSEPGSANYFADKLKLTIMKHGTTDVVWEGMVNELSTVWKNIATDISAGWQAYDLKFTLDLSMTKQGIVNTDTKILIYAVQHDGPVPTTMPFETSF